MLHVPAHHDLAESALAAYLFHLISVGQLFTDIDWVHPIRFAEIGRPTDPVSANRENSLKRKDFLCLERSELVPMPGLGIRWAHSKQLLLPSQQVTALQPRCQAG